MNLRLIPVVLVFAFVIGLRVEWPAGAQEPPSGQATVDWSLDRLDSIGGHPTSIVGTPQLVAPAEGGGIAFDGQVDGVFINTNPLAGLRSFTAEVVFRPHAEGPKEQRFLHFQEAGSENRLLFETRLTADGQWFLDTFLKVKDGNHTLLAEKSRHEIGPWYAAAVVVDEVAMRHYVNGQQELTTPITMHALAAGQMSLGVRINKVSWYRGAIRRVRVTPRVLSPAELLRP